MGEGWRSWSWDNQPAEPEHSSVPSWEKTFCTSVCHVPWDRICDSKVWICNYKNVADWDDSGSLEAFENAKARYWAELNNLPCEIPLPDPDMFIDEVDHNTVIDPKLIADLYKKPPTPPPCPAGEYEDLSYQAFLNKTLPVKATGWGDEEEGEKNESLPNWGAPVASPLPVTTGWRDSTYDEPKNYNNFNRRRNGKRNNGYGPRFLKPTQQLNNHQQGSVMAGSYGKKTTPHAGRPPTVMGQWLPKPQTLMKGQ